MSEPVDWQPDGTPRSPRFDDIYRSATGGLAQARHAFLQGCGLPGAWAGAQRWVVLETGFGLGLNFLATWHAWLQDPQHPRILHFVSIEAWPVAAHDLIRSASPYPQLLPLAHALADQWWGLTPGIHRLEFERGCVLLTLDVRDIKSALREPRLAADSVFLDGFDPRRNEQMWDAQSLKAIARHCRRGTRIATWTAAGTVRRELARQGFAVEKIPGLPPKRHSLAGTFAPAWEPKGARIADPLAPSECVVIGAGLAGCAVAASLASRGWRVAVFDGAHEPAQGASAVPAALLAPNYSPDDNLLSRLSRAGVRACLHQARTLLSHGDDWSGGGSLERRSDEAPMHGANCAAQVEAWSRHASAIEKELAGLHASEPALWHASAAWIKPAALARAWLRHPLVDFRGGIQVARLESGPQGWQILDSTGAQVARTRLVVIAAAHDSTALLPAPLPLLPVRGQVTWGTYQTTTAVPPFPVHGQGHFIGGVPTEGGLAWYCGSTYARGDTDLGARSADDDLNLQRLQQLMPAIGAKLAPQRRSLRSWTGVRCASADRRPMVGQVAPALWISTAMGSRGLTFARLCAELLAARLHGEPLPLEQRLARALDPARAAR